LNRAAESLAMSARDAGIPLYTQVAETLRRRIQLRDYPEGSLLPGSDQLQNEFGVSEITVRKALTVLVEEGLLERKRGLGTFVTQSQQNLVTIELSGSSEHLVRLVDKLPTDLTVLDAGVVECSNHVARDLGLQAGAPVWRLQKLRSHDGSPFCHYFHYCIPGFGRLIDTGAAAARSFPDIFREATRLKLSSIRQRLEATSADSGLSQLLGVKFGAPLLFVENLYVTQAGENVLLTQIHYRADRVTVRSTVSLLDTQAPATQSRQAKEGNHERPNRKT